MQKLLPFLLIAAALPTRAFSQHVSRRGMTSSHAATSPTPPPARFGISQLSGKWQEITRTGANGELLAFTDTLLISIRNGKGFVKSETSMDMDMSGGATIYPPAILEVAGQTFDIKSAEDKAIVLGDDEGIHSFKKVTAFRYEGEGKDSVSFPKNVPMAAVNLHELAGKWWIYRRQASPGFIDDHSILVKSLSFLSISDDSTATGEIVTYDNSNVSTLSPCSFRFADGKLDMAADGRTVTVNVYRAGDNEFIFGSETGVMNYARH